MQSSMAGTGAESYSATTSGQGIEKLVPQHQLTPQSMIAYSIGRNAKIPVPIDLFANQAGSRTTTGDLLTIFNNTPAFVKFRLTHASDYEADKAGFDLYKAAFAQGTLSPEAPWATMRIDNTFGLLLYAVTDRNSGIKSMVTYPLDQNIDIKNGYGDYQIVRRHYGVGPAGYSITVDNTVPEGPHDTVRITTRVSDALFSVALMKNSSIVRVYEFDPTGNILEFALPNLTCVNLYSYFSRNDVDEKICDPILVSPGSVLWICKSQNRALIASVTSNEDLLAVPSRSEIALYLNACNLDPNRNY